MTVVGIYLIVVGLLALFKVDMAWWIVPLLTLIAGILVLVPYRWPEVKR